MTDIPLVLKFDNWPLPDKALWSYLFEEADLFDDTGQLAHWRSGSQQMLRQAYGQWLSFLARNHDQALLEVPLTRVRPDLIGEYIKECQLRLAPRTVYNLVTDICILARAAEPKHDLDWLHRVAKRLARKVDSANLKKPIPLTADQVFDWSLRRLAEVQSDPALSEKKRAIHFRDALLIGFLIARPVRKGALLAMDVDRHLLVKPHGFALHFPKEDMKDGRTRDYPFPEKLTTQMKEYLDVHRPVLLGENDGTGLWINQYGKRFAYEGFTRMFGKLTETHLGFPLRPHAFRHIVATSIAELDPAHVGIIRDILGHSTLDMAEKHYNRASQVSSCNALQALHSRIIVSVKG
ncbi:site-specific integrase [Roseovarius indicus]|uniref:Tyrosine recombinase XerD n=1 Tax=Roseovarius indicus TaxID=540747 RepID=A0A0T5NTJ8_9RHOB|nr:site-specific integrase [Roseovarius indicus]KRS12062.1 hypothetical protein XM52_28360 [Roseovarius indicus]QEW27921.1 Tyrosine recombinase XerD [Roseovarius indicus]SFE86298.1 Phage integrase family protein [Roseovarius indicus]